MNSFIPIILTLDSVTIVLLGILLIKQSNCSLFNSIKKRVSIPTKISILNSHSADPYEKM